MKKGIMIISILMLMVLLMIMTTSMLFIATQTLNILGKSEDRVLAAEAAEAGIEYARYKLSNDISWGNHMTSDIVIDLGNKQECTIIFNPGEHHSGNNLEGNTQIGTIPPYSAEIICKGIYRENGTEKQKVYLRAVFTRDDEYPCPVYSGGNICISGGNTKPPINFTGNETEPSPVRIHSNATLSVTDSLLDLSEGFLSSSSSVELINVNDDVMYKEGTLPVRIPVINITKIIEDRKSTCHYLPADTFYLAGYFEYDSKNPYNSDDPNGRKYWYNPSDPNARWDPNDPNCPPYNPYDNPDDPWDEPNEGYCIPHSSSGSTSDDPKVHTSGSGTGTGSGTGYKFGIASFKENSYDNFINNYGDFYYNPPVSDPNCVNRNFYNYYSVINFLEYDDDPNSCFQQFLRDELAMSMKKEASGKITMTLEDDIYIPSVTGLFETDMIGQAETAPGGTRITPAVYFPENMKNTLIRLNFNNHKIYGNKLWLGITPSGTGGIISDKTIDFICSGEVMKMLTLSEESVRMLYRESAGESAGSSSTHINYRGIIYAKDDILIQTNSLHTGNKDFKFYGTMLSKGIDPNTCTASPMACYPLMATGDKSIYIETGNLNNAVIVFTADGRDNLANLRGKDYTIKRAFTEELNSW